YGFHEDEMKVRRFFTVLKAGMVGGNGMLNKSSKILNNPKQIVPSLLEAGARLFLVRFPSRSYCYRHFDIVTKADLGLGEAYVNGDFSFTENTEGLYNLIMSNEVFSLFLDETMTYSCALFESEDEDLKVAQLRKISSLIEKGGFTIEIVKQTGCNYTGITLSKEQIVYAKNKVKEAGLQGRIRFLLCDYRQLPNTFKYDRIISCEAIEHVGHEYYEEFFASCESLLSEDGSKIHGKPLRRMSHNEFAQKQIKREKEERIGKCIRQITRDCKNMLRKKIEEIEVYNSTISQNKYKQYNCFYCNQKGHIFKSCPTKIKDEVEHAQGHPVEIAEGNIEVNNTTQAKITRNKNMVLCFKFQEYGHFVDKCPSKKQGQPKVSLKYPEFIHFKTKGIIKGTDKEKLEGHRKLLFTYGMGEVLIMDESNGYLIPGVHYAPEITLNILSINLLKQQGFEIIFEGDRCTLEYMFKNQQGHNMDVDKMRQRHNDYLDDYFESLDKEKTDREEEMPRFMEDTNTSEVHTFYEFVAFLNLIKNDDKISKIWDIYKERFDKVLKWFYNHYLKRPLPGTIPPIIHGVLIHLFDLYKLMDCMGGYLSVQFGQEFSALAEILGLTRSDGEEIRKCYITYLDVFISYCKTARALEDPTKVEEDSESLEPYQWNIGKTCAPIAMEKRKEKLEHFGIKLEEEEDCKEQ
nr:ARID DNA-binding domain-containing protein [Tanacetum cinerariifolium]